MSSSTKPGRLAPEQVATYFEKALSPSMGANLRRKGIPEQDVPSLVSEVSSRLWEEATKKVGLSPQDIWTFANRKCLDVAAEYFRRSSQAGGDADLVPDAKELQRAYIKEEMENYRAAKEAVLEASQPHYKGNEPLVIYDRMLVELWEENPEASVRNHGRALKHLLQDQHDETFACKRLALFLQRLRAHLG